jgi:hypothetical protein
LFCQVEDLNGIEAVKTSVSSGSSQKVKEEDQLITVLKLKLVKKKKIQF